MHKGMKHSKYGFSHVLIVLLIAAMMVPAAFPLTGGMVFAAEEETAEGIPYEAVLTEDGGEALLQDEEPAAEADMSGLDEEETDKTDGAGGANGTAGDESGGTGTDEPAVPQNPQDPGQQPQDQDQQPQDQDQQPQDQDQQPQTALPKVTVKGYTGTYDGKSHTVAVKGLPEDAYVEYRTSNGKWGKKAPSRKNVGTTTARYRIIFAGNRKATGSVTIRVKKAGLKRASLAHASYTYNGKVRHPAVKVYGRAVSSKLVKGRDYTVSYSKGCKKAGRYTVTIKGKGNYRGKITKTFKIKPGKAGLRTRSLQYGVLTLKTTKPVSSYGGGYFQIAYKKAGGSWKYVRTTSSKKSLSVPYNKKYYVKVRAVRKINGKVYCGEWSNTYKVVSKYSPKVEKVLYSSRTTASPGQGWCAAWVCNVFDRSGVLRSARMGYASDYYRRYCHSSNRADLRPGMIVCSRYSSGGGYAGHIGIYIGDGKVIGCEGPIVVRSLDSFSAVYSHGAPIRWGWMNNKKLL